MKLVIKIGIKIVFLCVFCFLFEGTLSAQVFPASATVRILPPYNTFIRELAQAGNERLQVILLQRDLATPSYQVCLKFKVFLDGNLLFETKPSYIAPIITIEGGIPTLLSGADLSSYFDAQNLVFTGMSQQTYLSSGNVPEGAYQFCATVFDAFVPTKVLSNAACQSFFMVRAEPPLLNMPACGTAILPNQLLTFRWNNVSSAGNWEYKLELFEIRNADGNPNNAVLSNSPIFTNTSTLNSYAYTPADPPLLPNMRYAWRVQAVDLNGINQVRNNGNSLVCDFTNQPQTASGAPITAIAAPAGIQAEAKSPTAGRVFWTPYAITTTTPLSDKPDSYHVEYKKVGSGFEWFKSSTSINDYVVVTDLEASTAYQARMQAKKGTFFSDYSAIVNFTTPAPIPIVCGTTSTSLLGSSVPYLGAMSGDRIKIDGFTLVLDSLAEGEGGVYGGDGLISVEFLAGKQFEVYFEGLFINELKEGGDGKVWFKMRDMDAWIQEMSGTDQQSLDLAAAQETAQANHADIDLDPNVLTYPGHTITNVSVNAQGVITLTTSAGAITVQATDLPNPRVLPIIIEDKDGQQWVVSPEGVVTAVPSGGLPPKYAYSDDKLEASDSLMVTFTDALVNNYGYDTKNYFKWSKNYEIILLKNNRNYFVPYQSVATNAANGTIIANVKFINREAKKEVAATATTPLIPAVPAFNYDISKVSFKLADGTVITPGTALTPPTTGFHTVFPLTIPAIDVGSRSMKETFIYAYYETKKIGKINITALKKKEEKLVIVAVLPPNTTAIPTPALAPSALQTYLNGIYKGANVEFTITSDTTKFDLGTGANEGLERSDENMFGKYSLEMRALKSHYMVQHPNYDKKASYIFVVPSFSGTGDLKGFMVRGRSVGFVVPDADMRTYAHELGHGVFGLEHTFPEISKDSITNNLMDYGTGTHLTHAQWKIIHARKPAYSWFDSEEDGANAELKPGADYFGFYANNKLTITHVEPSRSTKEKKANRLFILDENNTHQKYYSWENTSDAKRYYQDMIPTSWYSGSERIGFWDSEYDRDRREWISGSGGDYSDKTYLERWTQDLQDNDFLYTAQDLILDRLKIPKGLKIFLKLMQKIEQQTPSEQYLSSDTRNLLASIDDITLDMQHGKQVNGPKVEYLFLKTEPNGQKNWFITFLEIGSPNHQKLLEYNRLQNLISPDYIAVDYILKDGKLILGRQHSFLSGEAISGVKAAGELKINNEGKIISVNNSSGHYPSNHIHFTEIWNIFKASGLLKKGAKGRDHLGIVNFTY